MSSFNEFRNNENLLWQRMDIINDFINEISKSDDIQQLKDIMEQLDYKMDLPFNLQYLYNTFDDFVLLKAEIIKLLKKYNRNIKKNIKILNTITLRYQKMANKDKQIIESINSNIAEYIKQITPYVDYIDYSFKQDDIKRINKIFDSIANLFNNNGSHNFPYIRDSVISLMETINKFVILDNIKPFARKLNVLLKNIIIYFSMATDAIIKKKTTRQLYDLIIDYIKATDNKIFNNTSLNKLYKIHHQLINRTLKEDEYKEVIEELKKIIPKDEMVIIDGKTDYMRSVNKNIEKVKQSIQDTVNAEPQYYEIDIDAVNVYLSSDNLKEGKNKKKSVLKALKQKFLIDKNLSKDEINKLITRKIEKDTGLCCLDISNINLSPVEYKERVNDAVNGECVKIALKAWGINTDSAEFSEVITNKEITENVGFYNVYNNLMLGNPLTNNKLLVYNNHAIAYIDNTPHKMEILDITPKKYNLLLDDIEKYNIPTRSISDGYIEVFISEEKNKRSYNRLYRKPIMGSWVGFRVIIDDTSITEEIAKEHEHKELLDAEFMELKNSFMSVIIDDIRKKTNNVNGEKIDLSAYIVPFFPYNYRSRVCYSKFTKGHYYELDMVKAYYTALKELNNILMISNIPMTKPMTKNYIVYAISSILPCGYYPKEAIRILQKMDPLIVFEYYEVYNVITDLSKLKRDLTDYKVSIGKLISLNDEYTLKDETNNINLNKVYFNKDYCALLHINIILLKNSIMLKEIYNNYKKNVLPVGYNIDAIFYNTQINEHSKYFHDCHEIYKDYENLNNLHINELIKQDEKTVIKPAINCLFGVAGSGKSTEIMDIYRDNETVIVNSYNLQRLYKKRSIDAVLYQLFAAQHKPIYTTKIYIDEIFTFSRLDIEIMLSIAGKYNIEITLIGDYNQLLPTCPNTPINNLQRTLIYVYHDYKFTNYRNCFKYNGIDSWLLDFDKDNTIKQNQLLNTLINKGYIEISNNDICFRWYKKDAIINESIYKGNYYILRNYSDVIPANIKRVFSTDCVYTMDEIEKIQKEYNINAIKYFVNNNAISFYNTQGQTLDKMNIINNDTLEQIKRNNRMFYVFVSRLTIKEL